MEWLAMGSARVFFCGNCNFLLRVFYFVPEITEEYKHIMATATKTKRY